MSGGGLGEDLRGFIKAALPSVWALETLLALRARADQSWTPEAVARELRSNPRLAHDLLETFVAVGLAVKEEAGYRYAPASPALNSLAQRIAEEYRERPVAVVNAIVQARDDTLQSFADAFRFKGKP